MAESLSCRWVLAQLAQLHQQQRLRGLDWAYANWLAGYLDEHQGRVLLLATWVSQRLGQGHVCLLLHGRVLDLEDDHPLVQQCPASSWAEALQQCPLVAKLDAASEASAQANQPLLWQPPRLYLHKYWHYEQRVAQRLCQLASQEEEGLLPSSLHSLFGAADPAQPNWQQVAAAIALRQRLLVLSGGPGTGKTTTVTRLLALLQEQQTRRIALAAPTGKAAMRLTDSIRQAKARLDLPSAWRERIPEQASTLHRLLGVRGDGSYRYHALQPLHLDVLVVDEASMIDLAMMDALLQALPAHASLILLGDHHQLASVEAGSVLGDICASPEPGCYSQQMQAYLAPLARLPKVKQVAPLMDSLCFLQISHRFRADSGIGRLATQVRQGQFGIGQEADVHFYDWRQYAYTQLLEACVQGYQEYWQAVQQQATAEQIWACFERFRVLVALREGPLGVAQLNQAIVQRLRRLGYIKTESPWYVGRPLMITSNDYQTQVFNGDIGLVLAKGEGLQVCFMQADGSLRWLAPSRLPAHEDAWVMTIHKSQGSEFEHTLMALPAEDHPLLTRELVYTGITRAKQQLSLFAHPGVLAKAAARPTLRDSGLAWRLWGE
ncbi:exodeoxyribonuclease V subunit alpha [Balneatrix alpica]|uniref:exodeoxyribonuclease V subunit alpha n=1 Tax=Balneatrix alpica TaxID=75684 RepID=UPI0027388B37|nr:exodeoxyribonuclease V subunit alpha [Balneatrix alpica]